MVATAGFPYLRAVTNDNCTSDDGQIFDLDQATPLTHFHFSNVSLFR
jgi:hypothetical protein